MILPTAYKIKKVIISILQMRMLILEEFKIEGDSELAFGQFGVRAGNPNFSILSPLVTVMTQACVLYMIASMLFHLLLHIILLLWSQQIVIECF